MPEWQLHAEASDGEGFPPANLRHASVDQAARTGMWQAAARGMGAESGRSQSSPDLLGERADHVDMRRTNNTRGLWVEETFLMSEPSSFGVAP